MWTQAEEKRVARVEERAEATERNLAVLEALEERCQSWRETVDDKLDAVRVSFARIAGAITLAGFIAALVAKYL